MCKVTVHLKSTNPTFLRKSEEFFKKTIEKTKAPISMSLIMRQTFKKRYTVIKSPHVHKKSREQFQFTEYHQYISMTKKESKKQKKKQRLWRQFLLPILKSSNHFGVQLKTSIYHGSFLK